jgi:hypothetical protein
MFYWALYLGGEGVGEKQSEDEGGQHLLFDCGTGVLGPAAVLLVLLQWVGKKVKKKGVRTLV